MKLYIYNIETSVVAAIIEGDSNEACEEFANDLNYDLDIYGWAYNDGGLVINGTESNHKAGTATYRVVMKDNQGNFAADALASAIKKSLWRNSVERFDGTNDLVFIEVPADDADYFEEVMDADDNVIEYGTR